MTSAYVCKTDMYSKRSTNPYVISSLMDRPFWDWLYGFCTLSMKLSKALPIMNLFMSLLLVVEHAKVGGYVKLLFVVILEVNLAKTGFFRLLWDGAFFMASLLWQHSMRWWHLLDGYRTFFILNQISLLTQWLKNLRPSSSIVSSFDNPSVMWVNIVSSWLCSFIYLCSLIKPACLSD